TVRQFQYFKLHFPFAFRALVVWELLASAVLLGLPFGTVLDAPPAVTIAPAAVYLGGLTVMNLRLLDIGGGRSGPLARTAASILFAFLVIYVTLAAWRRRELIWHGIAYQMDAEGNVLSAQLRVPRLQGEPEADP
ncbi:MAG: hypothetical protein ACJ79G_09545, partial [Myxococcales bacterium]